MTGELLIHRAAGDRVVLLNPLGPWDGLCEWAVSLSADEADGAAELRVLAECLPRAVAYAEAFAGEGFTAVGASLVSRTPTL